MKKSLQIFVSFEISGEQKSVRNEKTCIHIRTYTRARVGRQRGSQDRGETRGRFAYTRLPATWLPFVLYLPDDLPTPR